MIVYKFRLCPTPTQERMLNKTLETCRTLYNLMLADRMENRRGFFEQKRALTVVRKGDKFLRAVQSHVLQDVALRLDKACGAFFAGSAGTRVSEGVGGSTRSLTAAPGSV